MLMVRVCGWGCTCLSLLPPLLPPFRHILSIPCPLEPRIMVFGLRDLLVSPSAAHPVFDAIGMTIVVLTPLPFTTSPPSVLD